MLSLTSNVVVHTKFCSDLYSSKFMHESKEMFVRHVLKFLPDVSAIYVVLTRDMYDLDL